MLGSATAMSPDSRGKAHLLLTNIMRMLFSQNVHFSVKWKSTCFPQKNKSRISKNVFKKFQYRYCYQILVILLLLCLGPKVTSRFDDWLGGLTGLSIYTHTYNFL